MASVQAAEDRDTTNEEIAARESIPVGHTVIVVTYDKASRVGLGHVSIFDVGCSTDSIRITKNLEFLLPGLLVGTIRSAVLVERTEDGWHDLLTMHND